MNIWFFEEFPNKYNLEKAQLINFPSVVFLAANSLIEFQKAKEKLKTFNRIIEPAYWPTLKTSYYVSPFSNTNELLDLYEDLKNIDKRTKILIDLELPILKTHLFLKNLFSLRKNVKIINSILKLTKNVEIFTAEHPKFSLSGQIIKMLGIRSANENKIPMCYTSIIWPPLRDFDRNIKSRIVGLGVIASGILGNENILKPRELDFDLNYFNKIGTKTIAIFRLGGLNTDYLRVVSKYI